MSSGRCLAISLLPVALEGKYSSLSPGKGGRPLGDGSSQKRHGFRGKKGEEASEKKPLADTDSTDRKRLGMSIFGTTFAESIRWPGYRGRRSFNPTEIR